ncbi:MULTISPECIES: CE1759 family FMN reductase [unclassified Luteococcus]|uniref:CE1759 family FMN reductase n=1 Tax=unclassified Luteococcus TaxID=2639923 RepID=UPI00313EFFAF
MKVVAISAGLGQPSSTHLLAERLVQATGADQVEHLELRLLAHDLVNALLTRVQSPALQRAVSDVVEADGLVVVSPVFNASFSGLFKMFFDVLHEGALLDKPVLLAATGGTPRHSLAIDQALLPLFFYLKAAVVPTAVFAATEDWGDAGSGLERRIGRAGRELAAMVRLRTDESLPEALDEDPQEQDEPQSGAPQPLTRKKAQTATAGDFTLTKSFEEMFDAI